MTATTYVRADKDELVVDVTGADPNSTQTARINLQNGRNPDGRRRRRDRAPRRDVGGHRQRSRAAPARRSAASPPSPPAAANVDRARGRRAHRRGLLQAQRRRHVPRHRRLARRGPAATPQATAAALIGTDATAANASAPRTCSGGSSYWAKVGLIRLSPPTAPRTTWRTCARSSSTSRARPSAARSRPARRARTRCSTSAATARAGAAATTGTGTCACTSRPTWARATPTPTCRASASTATTSRASAAGRSSGWAAGPASACRRRCASTAPAGTRAPTTATRAAIAAGPPEWNRRNLTTGAKVSLRDLARTTWRPTTARSSSTTTRCMADAARFLLAYAVEGADGKLHTSPSNAHETQWDVATRSPTASAMKTLFPIVVEAAHAARPRRARSSPSCRRRSRRSSTSRRETRNGQTVFAYSANPTGAAAQRREPRPRAASSRATWSPTRRRRSSRWRRRTYATRRFVNANDWSLDAVDAARLHNGAEVAARLRATTSSLPALRQRPRQPRPGGRDQRLRRARRRDRAGASTRRWRPDFDGIAADRARGAAGLERRGHRLPAAPLEGPRAGPGRRRSPPPRSSTARPRATSASRTRGPAGRAGRQAARARPSSCRTTSAAIITIPAAANGTYLIQRPTAPTDRAADGDALRHRDHRAPATWPAANAQDRPRPARTTSRPSPCPMPTQTPLFAWDPTSGDDDPRLVDATAATASGPAAPRPTSPRARRARAPSITGTRYLRTPATTLGFLREATWAAEIKINAGDLLPPDLGLEDRRAAATTSAS